MIPHRNLLLYLLIAFNTAAGAASVWAYLNGYAAIVFEDASYIPHALTALFLFGLAATFIRGFQLSRLIDKHKSGTRGYYSEKDAERASIKQSVVYAVSDWLVYGALIGTAVGILVMVPEGSTAEQLHAATSGGLRIALPATIMGFILALWTSVNHHLLDTAAKCLIVDCRR